MADNGASDLRASQPDSLTLEPATCVPQPQLGPVLIPGDPFKGVGLDKRLSTRLLSIPQDNSKAVRDQFLGERQTDRNHGATDIGLDRESGPARCRWHLGVGGGSFRR